MNSQSLEIDQFQVSGQSSGSGDLQTNRSSGHTMSTPRVDSQSQSLEKEEFYESEENSDVDVDEISGRDGDGCQIIYLSIAIHHLDIVKGQNKKFDWEETFSSSGFPQEVKLTRYLSSQGGGPSVGRNKRRSTYGVFLSFPVAWNRLRRDEIYIETYRLTDYSDKQFLSKSFLSIRMPLHIVNDNMSVRYAVAFKKPSVRL